MTASLLVFVPVALLVLVGGVCFVGCVLDTSGLGLSFTEYSDKDIINHPDCVAYWRLNDLGVATTNPPSEITAVDTVGKNNNDPHNGKYKNKVSNPSLFPCPGGPLDPPNNTAHSAVGPGDLTIAAPGIVTGDTMPPNDPKNPISFPCMQTNGAFVIVDSNATCNPPVFSAECWVFAEWDANDGPALRFVIDSRENAGSVVSGFAMYVNEAGNWEALVADGGGTTFALVTGGKAALTTLTHVVLTYDGAVANLFVDGKLAGSNAITGFVPNTTQPLTIGAGFGRLPERTDPSQLLAFPLCPFKGKIQDVAIYKAALSVLDVTKHHDNGLGQASET
ncbi:MAG: LamG domain-containing protein [Pseudolabrys sp.]|jgi:hypothetical protein